MMKNLARKKKGDEKFQRAEYLVHLSFQKSNYQVMLVDAQGVKYKLFGLEIGLAVVVDNHNEVLFSTGNFSTNATAATFVILIANA